MTDTPPAAPEDLRVERQGAVLRLTIQREERRNAMSPAVLAGLTRAIEAAQADRTVRAIVITGAGSKAFCAGADLQSGKAFALDPSEPVGDFARLLRAAKASNVPLIARVNGAATGLGATLAVYADLSIADESAVIGDPHVKVGLVAGDGGALMWPMLIGFQKAKELLFLGDNIPAAEAARLGLITHAVPAAELDARIDALVERLLKLPPLALRGTKKAINHTLKGLALATFEYGVSLETQSQLTRDHAEAVNAFIEKRRPAFTGR